MLDVTKILITELQNSLKRHFVDMFNNEASSYLALSTTAADMSLTAIARCNASYHNVEHTIYVTSAGLSILEGRHSESPLTEKGWCETILSLLYHDVGFVRGLCERDGNGQYYSGKGDENISLVKGSTDASLMPYHVDRGQCFVSENYAQHDINIEFIQTCIERTRFPIPPDAEYQTIDDMPGLVRAADLIGQFSDPRYINKLNALFQEFDEQGINARIGYEDLEDMCKGYPDFFDSQVRPFIKEGVRLLEKSERGKEILRSMENNLDIARNCDIVAR